MPVVEPTDAPVFAGSDSVQSIAMAPDKPVLYVHVVVPTVNLWPSVVRLWPELLGGSVAVLALFLSVVLTRIRRRRRQRGCWYCRRCNYELAPPRPAPAARCTECGVDLARVQPVRGRAFLRRAALPLGLWFVAAVGYAGMFVCGLPRNGRADTWLDWSSVWVARYADTPLMTWLKPTKGEGERVLQLDLAEGRVDRIVATRPRCTANPVGLSPRGDVLFICRDPQVIEAVSVRTGRVLNSASLPDYVYTGDSPLILGFSVDGSTAYIQWGADDPGERHCGVVAWDWRHGNPSHPLPEVVPFDQRFWRSARRFVLRDHRGSGGGPRFVSLPLYHRDASYNILLHDGKEEPRRVEVAFGPEFRASTAISPDGSTMYITGSSSSHLLRFDLDTPGTAPRSYQHEPAGGDMIARSRDGRYLVVESGKGLSVLDTLKEKWRIKLVLPPKLYAPRVVLSPDGRWAAAVCQGGRPHSFIHRVVVWDLGEHRLVEDSETK